jgi:LemA protein
MEFLVIGVVVFAAIGLVLIYNRLVELKHRVANAYAQIDVQLKRRHDLIPNLVEVAKNYMSYERATLEAITAARTAAQAAGRSASQNPTSAQAIAAVAATEGALSATLGRFFGLVENYPDLKANQTMMQLSEELTSTENRIAFARQAFNDAVMRLNVGVESFPAVLFAGALGFRRAEMLQPLEREAQREPPAMSF